MTSPTTDQTTGGVSTSVDAATGRRLERLLGGDPITEQIVLNYIAARWSARTLLFIPPAIAAAIIARPPAFIAAAKQFAQPELPL